jgi:hypothetical protein
VRDIFLEDVFLFSFSFLILRSSLKVRDIFLEEALEVMAYDIPADAGYSVYLLYQYKSTNTDTHTHTHTHTMADDIPADASPPAAVLY